MTTTARPAPAPQLPGWADPAQVSEITGQLAALPPLVIAAECDALTERLAAVTRGEAFVLQGGDCAETFAGATADAVRGKLQTLLQMAVVLTYGAQVPIVKIGRMAGQFAKPRSQPEEVRDGVTLPAYRGDAVNGFDFTARARTPDPGRLIRAYHCSAATLNLCRAFTTGGYADLHQVHAWNQDFVARSPSGQRYERLAGEIDRALAFMRACGADPSELRSVELYSSHEALVLDYEHALTRTDPRTGRRYDASAHFLWIGERTRALGGAHVGFASGIANPVGVKLGPGASPADVLALIERLKPGAWVCDPMHGNTFEAPSGHKTRRFDDVLGEVQGFFEVHRSLGTHPGGIHIEFTGDNVTECVGGSYQIAAADLHQRYETFCDPRLNRRQALDLAFTVADSYARPAAAGRAPDGQP